MSKSINTVKKTTTDRKNEAKITKLTLKIRPTLEQVHMMYSRFGL